MPGRGKKSLCSSLQLIVRFHIFYQYLHPKTIYTDCIYRKIHKKSKGKPCEMDLSFLKNDITTILRSQKPAIYSRYMKSGFNCNNNGLHCGQEI
jgi:hypothetical protein